MYPDEVMQMKREAYEYAEKVFDETENDSERLKAAELILFAPDVFECRRMSRFEYYCLQPLKQYLLKLYRRIADRLRKSYRRKIALLFNQRLSGSAEPTGKENKP